MQVAIRALGVAVICQALLLVGCGGGSESAPDASRAQTTTDAAALGADTQKTALAAGARTAVVMPTLAAVRNGVYTVASACNAQLLDVRYASVDDGAPLIQWPSNRSDGAGSDNQRWAFKLHPAGGYSIAAVHSRKAITVNGAGVNGSPPLLRQRTDTGAPGQRWYVLPNSDATFTLVPISDTTRVMDLQYASAEPGAPVWLWPRNGSCAQRWRLVLRGAAIPNPAAVEFGCVWKPLKEGGGGFVTGLSLHSGGVVQFARTDTYGAYRWDGNLWTQMVSAKSLPAADLAPEQFAGVQALAVAPSDVNRVYMLLRNTLYRSNNSGATWQRTAFGNFKFDANDGARTFNDKLAVHPSNPNTVLVGLPRDGLWRSTDGGATWQVLAGVPKGQEEGSGPGITGIVFSKSTPQVVYAASHRNGVYRSSDGGDNWQRVSAGSLNDATVRGSSLASDGTLFVATDKGLGRFRLVPGSNVGLWDQVAGTGDRAFSTVAVDPINPKRVYAIDDGGGAFRSTDGGQTFNTSSLEKALSATGDAPWLAWTDQGYFANAHAVFDPVKPGRLWLAQGTGVWYADVTDTTTTISWQAQSRGIEQRVANDIAALPGGRVITAGWDFGLFYRENPDAYPSERGPSKRFNSAWNVANAAGNPNLVVASVSDHRAIAGCWYWCQVDGQSIQSGYSVDGGKNWTVFPTLPAPALDAETGINRASQFGFGAIAISTNAQHIVWAPTSNQAPWRTSDFGKSWTRIALPNAPADKPGSHFAYFLQRRTLTADTVDPQTFYLYHTDKGMYRSIDGGASWVLAYAGELGPFSDFNAKLRAVPGRRGHLFFTVGPLDGLDAGFVRSVDGGATWQTVPNLTRVRSIGYGKPQQPGGYPTLFVAAKVRGVSGLWRSGDAGATWTQIAQYPGGTLDTVNAIEGDPDVFGRVYVGFAGSGFAYGMPR